MNGDGHPNDDAPQAGEATVNETEIVEQNDTGTREAGGRRPNRLLDLIRTAREDGEIKLWHTPGRREGFVTVECDGRREHLPIRSDAFKGWLLTKVVHALEIAKTISDKPTMIVAETIKGCGVSFMENRVEWHGRAPCEEEAACALEEIKSCLDE